MGFGFLNINKSVGPTSHDIVARVRKLTGIRQVGHAGTLDPMAEGVLVVALGRATRLIEYMAEYRKRYFARIQLGLRTDTYDAQGQILDTQPVPPDLTVSAIETLLKRFTGDVLQTPPAHSALKVGGRPAYARLRAGEIVTLRPRRVQIHQISIVSLADNSLSLDVQCSGGTYIRSLADDIGEAIGCGATLIGLVRASSGPFKIEDAIKDGELSDRLTDSGLTELMTPLSLAFAHIPCEVVTADDLADLRQGRAIRLRHATARLIFACAPSGELVAALKPSSDPDLWRPVKVFPQGTAAWAKTPTQVRP